jgi:hypothetical protein
MVHHIASSYQKKNLASDYFPQSVWKLAFAVICDTVNDKLHEKELNST